MNKQVKKIENDKEPGNSSQDEQKPSPGQPCVFYADPFDIRISQGDILFPDLNMILPDFNF